MKVNTQKDPEKIIWDHMRSPSSNLISGPQTRTLPKLMVWLILFVSVTYVVYTLKLVSTSRACNNEPFTTNRHLSSTPSNNSVPLVRNHTSLAIPRGENQEPRLETGFQHIVFGIAASAKLWEQRQNYIKIWYKPQEMRGIVWLDDKVKNQEREDSNLPPIKISSDTSRFSYTNKQGHRLGPGFVPHHALDLVLSRTMSMSLPRSAFLAGQSWDMFWESRVYGASYDVYGNLFGLLASHPVTPLVSLHHLDVVEPIFPNATRVQALQWLKVPMKLDSAGLMQQSICYDKSKRWTVSVSWGFAVQIFRGVFSPREIEMPSRTFLNWYRKADYTAYAFNTRPVSRNPCQKPFVFYLSKAKFDSSLNTTVSEYTRHHVPHPACRWKMPDPDKIETIVVHKKPDPHLWDRSPRRNCCRVMSTKKKGSVMVNVGVCRDGEISEVQV
ncbi:FRINGE-RELATED [Salix viminalis]|uniref:FRINGE-RELATED n=1 Tax=Salix viminalis TaxID=40686 RepID=A0A9Q0YY51_SALVM|nr:FRINGE-RELATED [Salix viminalis]